MQKLISILLVFMCFACSGPDPYEAAPTSPYGEVPDNPAQRLVEGIRLDHAPDKRVAIFNVVAEEKGKRYILKGETNLPEAKAALLALMEAQNYRVDDEISMLPHESLGKVTYAVINNSVANLRSAPKHSAELATQATLGTLVKVLKKKGDFYLVQTPDKYLAWVDHGGIYRITEARAKDYLQAPKVIYTEIYGTTYDSKEAKAQPVSDIVLGALLELVSTKIFHYEVRYPDGRTAFIPKKEAQPYDKWLKRTQPSAESLVSTAKELMGLPYLWGGTSSKGVDCSGYTKTLYFQQGMILARDASQQVNGGILVDEAGDFSKLEPGDLLFFGRAATAEKKERVTHVGMWIGDRSFIHASGRVRISSVDPKAPDYDEFNKNRYLRSKRYLGKDIPGVGYLSGEVHL